MEKLWGYDETLYSDDRMAIIRIHVQAGGFSSRHKHLHKHNAFIVVEGELSIECFESESPVLRKLAAGNAMFVAAGIEHRFIAGRSAVVAYEIYTASDEGSIDPSDIVRIDVGGLCRPIPTVELAVR